jgi:hypothetical protein
MTFTDNNQRGALIELLVVMPHCDTGGVAAVGLGAFQTYNLLICLK